MYALQSYNLYMYSGQTIELVHSDYHDIIFYCLHAKKVTLLNICFFKNSVLMKQTRFTSLYRLAIDPLFLTYLPVK